MQPSDTAELVEKLEDAQMALGSMASNRFGGSFREEVSAWLGKLGVISEQVQSHSKHHAILWGKSCIDGNLASALDDPAFCISVSATGGIQCPHRVCMLSLVGQRRAGIDATESRHFSAD